MVLDSNNDLNHGSYVYGIDTLAQLHELKIILYELQTFNVISLSVRLSLHHLINKKALNEVLTFAMQLEVAEMLGYKMNHLFLSDYIFTLTHCIHINKGNNSYVVVNSCR